MKRRGSGDQQARQPQGWWQQFLAWSGRAKKTPDQPKPRVRFRLLLLLWVWAALMFVVVDLFHNVPEFDGIRPRAELYGTARDVAHGIVGERVETVVVGTVVNPSGQPIQGAVVAAARGLQLAPSQCSVTADKEGFFELTLGVGTPWDSVAVTAPGYVAAGRCISTGFQRVIIVLQHLPVIRGCVRLSEGGTPSEFEVIVVPLSTETALQPPGPFGTEMARPSGTTCFRGTADEGGFLIKDLQSVPYSVVVRAPGRAVVRLSGVLPGPKETVQPIEISLPPTHPDER